MSTVQRVAPGLYRVQGSNGGSRMVRIHSVRSVKDHRSEGCEKPGKHPKDSAAFQRLLAAFKGSALILLSYRQARILRDAGMGKATDGCSVAPDGYCSHNHPSNAILWGIV